jgi:hypothetical protein
MKLDLLSNVSTVETPMKFITDYKNSSRKLIQNDDELPHSGNGGAEIPNNSLEEKDQTTTAATNKVF